MHLHDQAIFPKGYFCASRNCGLKDAGNDLSVFYSEAEAVAAGLFTRNRFPGAPVILGREVIRGGRLRAIVVNSKIANVGTGEAGLENARRMALKTAAELDVPASEVLVSSTGVIAKPLPIDRIESGIEGIRADLCRDPLVGAEGLMTTDTHPKAISLNVGDAVLTVVAKGSGMISPDMATMLVYIFTDARIDPTALDRMLREAADDSFHMLSVDMDMSTSDTCVAMANGLTGPVETGAFSASLSFACVEMARILARDGEGATKLLEARVTGAATTAEARFIARALINSPLIKTMAYGADPNIGRVLMAVGKCVDCTIEPERIRVIINDRPVFANLARVAFDEADIRRTLARDRVHIDVDLGVGNGEATAFGCDLTEGYIEENAAYYSS